MAFSWDKIKKPIVALAPIAGWTDSAYRQICKKLSPDLICFSELTSTNAIKYQNEKTLRMLDFDKSEYPLIMQLFGNKPEFYVEAGKRLEQLGIAGIDINMGCPARKVIYSEQGAALLKDSCLAAEIVHKLSKAVKIPVSVKTRIGYDKYEPEEMIKFLKALESAGAKLITLHGRTVNQGFSGKGDWEAIYLAKENLKIPVIGNGDITSLEIAKDRLNPKKGPKLDGIMIGRASFGNPWLLAEICAKLHKKRYLNPSSIQEKMPLIRDHLALSLKIKGPKVGLLEMRKHLGTYIRGFEKASLFRQKLMTVTTLEEIHKILDEIEQI